MEWNTRMDDNPRKYNHFTRYLSASVSHNRARFRIGWLADLIFDYVFCFFLFLIKKNSVSLSTWILLALLLLLLLLWCTNVNCSLSLALFLSFCSVNDPLPYSFDPEYQAASRAFQRYHNMDPIFGISSKYVSLESCLRLFYAFICCLCVVAMIVSFFFWLGFVSRGKKSSLKILF